MNCIFFTLKIISGESYGRKILKNMPDVPCSETYRLSHLSSNLLYTRGDCVPCLDTFSDVRNRVFSLPATFLENGMRENFWKKFHLFLLVKPVIWAIILWNPLLGTLRIAYCTTSKVLKSRFFHFKPRCWRRIWTKNSVKIPDVSRDNIYRWCEF